MHPSRIDDGIDALLQQVSGRDRNQDETPNHLTKGAIPWSQFLRPWTHCSESKHHQALTALRHDALNGLRRAAIHGREVAMRARFLLTLGAVAALAACGGSQAEPKSGVSEPSLYTPKKKSKASADEDETAGDSDGKPFDDEAGKVVINRGSRKAAECRQHVSDMPSGEGEVEIVFDGTKGKVVEVKAGYGWEDISKQALRCLQNSWLGEYVPPFDGKKTIKHSLTLPSGKGKKGK